jgi:hypothetical protein
MIGAGVDRVIVAGMMGGAVNLETPILGAMAGEMGIDFLTGLMIRVEAR